MSDVSTKADLRDVRDSILDEMRAGFDRIHARLDLLNGRVSKSELEIGRHHERLKTLFARMFERRHHQRRDAAKDQRPLTKRDIGLVVGGGAGLIAVIKFLVWMAPALAALAP